VKQYLDLLADVYTNGIERPDRTGTGTKSLFGKQMRFNLQEGFPILTTKKIQWKSLIHELIWILHGDTDVKYLHDNGVHIWDSWADEDGWVGPLYGECLRKWGHSDGEESFDQLDYVIDNIKRDPNSRRHVITLWNPVITEFLSADDNPYITTCHGTVIQFYVADNKLSCSMYQRSGDIFLGVPFNISSYAAMTHIIANICELEVGDLIHSLGDVHLYSNHYSAAQQQLSREPLDLPVLTIKRRLKGPDDVTFDDLVLSGYTHHPAIKAEISI
jgi:thymidylate synthase